MENQTPYLPEKTFSKEAIKMISENLLKNGSVIIFKKEDKFVFNSGNNVSTGDNPNEAVLNSEPECIKTLKDTFSDIGIALKGGYCS